MEGLFRRTGRTTRMLKFAIEMAKEGKDIIVYSESGYEARRLSGILLDMDDEVTWRSRTLLEIGGGSVEFKFIGRDFDWNVLRNRGVSTDTIILVDHYAIEKKFPSITWMLYRFMKPYEREAQQPGGDIQ